MSQSGPTASFFNEERATGPAVPILLNIDADFIADTFEYHPPPTCCQHCSMLALLASHKQIWTLTDKQATTQRSCVFNATDILRFHRPNPTDLRVNFCVGVKNGNAFRLVSASVGFKAELCKVLVIYFFSVIKERHVND